MANHKSALKRVAVTAKKNLNNRVITSRVKTAIKSFDKSLEAGDQAAITAAEGEKEAAILRADAVKQQRILEAEGEAQAILAVQQANADAIRLLNEAMPSDKVLAIRSLEALAKVANGKATKIIIPSELQNLGGVVPSIKELLTDPKDAE